MKHGLRALGVLLVVVLAGCTDATPTPTAADIPDEPEAPPNTTTPLGDPIKPDEPQPPPELPPPGPEPATSSCPYSEGCNATYYSFFDPELSCQAYPRFISLHDNGKVVGTEGVWSYSEQGSGRARLTIRLDEDNNAWDPPLHIDLDLTWTSEDGPDEGLVMATLRATWDPFYNPEGWCHSWDSTYSKLRTRVPPEDIP